MDKSQKEMFEKFFEEYIVILKRQTIDTSVLVREIMEIKEELEKGSGFNKTVKWLKLFKKEKILS